MITQEFKEKYAALYWGQFVGIVPENYGKSPIQVTGWFMTLLTMSNLRLRSLESITDEEAVEVAKILVRHSKWSVTDRRRTSVKVSCGRYQLTIFFDGTFWFEEIYYQGLSKESKDINCDEVVHIIDHLRSRSFALPYLGVSVDEMVKEGFVEIAGQ